MDDNLLSIQISLNGWKLLYDLLMNAMNAKVAYSEDDLEMARGAIRVMKRNIDDAISLMHELHNPTGLE